MLTKTLEWVRVQSCHAHTPLPFVMCFVDVSVEPFGVHDAVRVVEQHIGKQNTRGSCYRSGPRSNSQSTPISDAASTRGSV